MEYPEKWKITGLTINESKTKCMVVTRNNHRMGHLDIKENKFERVDSFKYLGVDINKDANSYKEIKLRLAVQINVILDLSLYIPK
jgi:hypothetical protein